MNNISAPIEKSAPASNLKTLNARLSLLPAHPGYADFRQARLGFHGTAEPIEGDLRPGAHDGVFWMAECPSVAQAYIPLAGLSVVLSRPLAYELDERIRPAPHNIWGNVMRQMGHWPREVEIDPQGRPTSWSVDAGHPTYGEAMSFVERLGYDFSRDSVAASCRLEEGWTVLTPADARTPGQVFVTVLDGLKLADLRSELNSDLTDPGHRQIGLFAAMRQAGYDGIVIDDFAQCGRDHENIGHVSIGVFAASLASLSFLSYPATHCHLGECRDVATGEFQAFQKARAPAATIAAGCRERIAAGA